MSYDIDLKSVHICRLENEGDKFVAIDSIAREIAPELSEFDDSILILTPSEDEMSGGRRKTIIISRAFVEGKQTILSIASKVFSLLSPHSYLSFGPAPTASICRQFATVKQQFNWSLPALSGIHEAVLSISTWAIANASWSLLSQQI